MTVVNSASALDEAVGKLIEDEIENIVDPFHFPRQKKPYNSCSIYKLMHPISPINYDEVNFK